MKEKIVFIENSGLGNLILSTPMLKAIRKLKPNSEIIVLAWNRSIRILEGTSFVDLILTVEQGESILKNFLPFIDHLLISPIGALDNITSVLSKISKNIHVVKVGPNWLQHESEYKMSMARKLGYNGIIPNCEISLFNYNIENADKFLKYNKINNPFICINASYLKSDHWHMKHAGDNVYTRLLIKLHQSYSDHYFVFIGAKEDKGDADRIICNMNPTYESTNLHCPEKGECIAHYIGDVPEYLTINACGFSDDIKDTAAIISKSKLVIGNDGGLQHIAAALNIPTLTIFTFTNPIKNRPISKNSHLIMNKCDSRIKGCQHGHWNKCQVNGCLDVPVENIYNKVKEIYQCQVKN